MFIGYTLCTLNTRDLSKEGGLIWFTLRCILKREKRSEIEDRAVSLSYTIFLKFFNKSLFEKNIWAMRRVRNIDILIIVNIIIFNKTSVF